jgi:hypothetical protein
MGVPLNAVCQIAAWKNHELERYCCALVGAGLDLLAREVPYFGADDIEEVDQPESPAVAGISARVLKSAGVIQCYTGHNPDAGVFYGRRKSRHKSAHGREIHLYQIANSDLAFEFLKRHGMSCEPQQVSLFA